MDPAFRSVLQRPGTIVFPDNVRLLADLAGAGRVSRRPTGHLVFFRPDGRRVLMTDPDGHPLHECEWSPPAGRVTLRLARVRLEWGRWVGLKPGALTSSTILDLSRKPGWERLGAEDLRRMAAHSLAVPIDEVRFFYGDEDLLVDRRGQASIRHRKDALYVLENGTFDRARFMACLGAMHWDQVDFLPVVELFQSLLPGTGTAVFELIRGLYDDQNPEHPRPLRYRGIPTYPSEAAFRLFSAFFRPQAPDGRDPFPLFMDPARAHEVTWLPVPDPPCRYVDLDGEVCVTVQAGSVRRLTLGSDPAGLSYAAPDRQGLASGGRSMSRQADTLLLKDGKRVSTVTIRPAWGLSPAAPPAAPDVMAPFEWRDFFEGGPPTVEPARAYGAVLLYPDDDREIDETASQPFVADALQDLMEQVPDLARAVQQAREVLIDGFDAVFSGLIQPDHPRDYTILYSRPDYTQKQAQLLWNHLAREQRWDWMRRIRLMPEGTHREPAYARQYDLIYRWIPFVASSPPDRPRALVRALCGALRPSASGFVAGHAELGALLEGQRLRIIRSDPVDALPPFRMHLSILPKARLKPGLTLFQVQRV